METATMGRVLTEATIENSGDLWAVRNGLKTPDQVRRVDVTDALVDTGATTLALPIHLIAELGLSKLGEKRSRSSRGTGMVSMYEAVRVIIQGRDVTVDVMEVPDDVPVLIGQIPLEMMDLVVDPRAQKLIGNPANDGVQTLELY
jgi:clan AA aspartic protease